VALDEDLDRFARAHATSLLRFAVVVAPTGVDAADLVQECLVRVAGRLDRLGDDAAVAYCRRTITNLATDEHRRRARWRRLLPVMSVPDRLVASEDLTVDRDDMVGLLRSLPARQRSALVLRYWAGLNEQEIANTLQCPPGTVKSLISRGLATLRDRVDLAQLEGQRHD
jgi:RNA polymerase sigma-70 factor (sigma-E family)